MPTNDATDPKTDASSDDVLVSRKNHRGPDVYHLPDGDEPDRARCRIGCPLRRVERSVLGDSRLCKDCDPEADTTNDQPERTLASRLTDLDPDDVVPGRRPPITDGGVQAITVEGPIPETCTTKLCDADPEWAVRTEDGVSRRHGEEHDLSPPDGAVCPYVCDGCRRTRYHSVDDDRWTPVVEVATDGGSDLPTPPTYPYDVLANERRRDILWELARVEGSIPVKTLARRVAARENDCDLGSVTSDQYKRAYVSCYQTHLPALVACDVVEAEMHGGSLRGPIAATERVDDLVGAIDWLEANVVPSPAPELRADGGDDGAGSNGGESA